MEEEARKDALGPSPDKDEEIEIHYIKTSDFRAIHVDGACGGITPHQKIMMAVFCERFPIPTKVVHRLRPDGKGLAEEVKDKREGRAGVVRDVEAELIMDVDTAESLARWLNDKVEEHKAILKKINDGVN